MMMNKPLQKRGKHQYENIPNSGNGEYKMSIGLVNLKTNAFYSLMVTIIISIPMLMMYSHMVDESICIEEDYKGDVEKCNANTKAFQEYGWVLFIFPIVMGLMSGLFHVFPKSETKKKEPKERPKGTIKWIVPFVSGAIGILFSAPFADALPDPIYEQYKHVVSLIPIAIFILAFKWFNGHWFWESSDDEKSPNQNSGMRT